MLRINKGYLFLLLVSIIVFFFVSANQITSVKRSFDLSNKAPEYSSKIDNFDKVENEEIPPQVVEEDVEGLSVNDTGNGISEEIIESQDVVEEKIVQPETLPVAVPIKRNSDEIEIGFITDLHVSSMVENNGARKLKNVFSNRINYFVEQMNNNYVPDFLLVNGDVIEGTKVPANIGLEELRLTKNIFDQTNIPKYWAIGNHDLRSFKKLQWENTLGINYLRNSFEIRDYKIIILDSNFAQDNSNVTPNNSYTRGRVSTEEIKWLKKELKNTKKKVLIFMHHPPLWDIDAKTNINLPDNALELQSIFSEKNVLAVFAGHIEDLYSKKIDGVNYFVFPGIYKHPKYQGAFSLIKIKGDKITAEVSYLKNENEYQTVTIKGK